MIEGLMLALVALNFGQFLLLWFIADKLDKVKP